ncbi:MAG TPA: FMN-binding glutamate synthase family protein [Hyphomicrobiales bacterium]|nr:FMN-binding glutamate synthase family protein [Hyphomicrobiales bacterium]
MDTLTRYSESFFGLMTHLLSTTFVLAIGIGFLTAVVLYIIDVSQTTHTIRRNYPLIGRFRYLFEKLGEFFRQYLYSQDREELPFNRAQRSWVYRAAKNLDNTSAFGSTRDNDKSGHVIFINAGFPILDEDGTETPAITYGPYARQPYVSRSIFNISGMSYGALSRPAVQALSRGAALAGCWMCTGEGGLSDYHLEGGCDLIFQIGTAKYGVRDAAGNYSLDKLREIAERPQVKMFELKLAQGAKPGKGGLLPGVKVTEEIARIRGIPAGHDSISPNRHTDIANNRELIERIQWLREFTGKPVGIKTVFGDATWLEDLLQTINMMGKELAPDFITLDSGDGGTGAAPMTLLDDMGLGIRESLPLLVNKLEEFGLRERIRVITSGKLINPSDVAWALCVGADAVNSARGFMFSLGCIQALQCNRNTCPTGITTHNPKLQRGLVTKDKTQRVANYQRNMLIDVNIIAHSCGVSNPRLLSRRHARMVLSPNRSIRLVEHYKSH